MPRYLLGLEMGGLMEDPYFHVEHVRAVRAPDLASAKDKWAELTGCINDKDWDSKSKTYWGWEIVEVEKWWRRKKKEARCE